MNNVESILAEHGRYVSETEGDSMFPMLKQGKTRISCVKTDSEALKKYDLPVYRRASGKLVCHRIVDADGAVVFTRGDNRRGREKVPRESIIALVDGWYAEDGHFTSVTDKKYVSYVRFWNALYPLRYPVMLVRDGFRAIKRRLYHGQHNA